MTWDVLLRMGAFVVDLVVKLQEDPPDKPATRNALQTLGRALLDKAATLDEDQAEDQRLLDARIPR